MMTCGAVGSQAQETITSDWPIVEQCAEEPTTPSQDWKFDGTIFTQKGDGIHAIRSDIPTPYYVAFNGGSEFGNMGKLSPDGRWFAAPAGYPAPSPRGTSVYDIREVRVYSTDGRQ